MSITKQVGDKSQFALKYTFYQKTDDTELEMFVEGKNVLGFCREGEKRTTRWNLEGIAFWLRNFIENMREDPFPFDCTGQYAAEKEKVARDFDSDDDDIFDAYYDKLYEWDLRHRWHTESNGAVLANVYFQLVGENVEISWDNENAEPNVEFMQKFGGASIPKDIFINAVNTFLSDYADEWYSEKLN